MQLGSSGWELKHDLQKFQTAGAQVGAAVLVGGLLKAALAVSIDQGALVAGTTGFTLIWLASVTVTGPNEKEPAPPEPTGTERTDGDGRREAPANGI